MKEVVITLSPQLIWFVFGALSATAFWFIVCALLVRYGKEKKNEQG